MLKKIIVILVGSSIWMIKKITESRAGALYGRALKIKISPFRYVDFRLMFKDLSEKEKVERYSVFGGTPYYLDKTKHMQSTIHAISELILKKLGQNIDVKEVLEDFPRLKIEDIKAAVMYAESLVENTEVFPLSPS